MWRATARMLLDPKSAFCLNASRDCSPNSLPVLESTWCARLASRNRGLAPRLLRFLLCCKDGLARTGEGAPVAHRFTKDGRDAVSPQSPIICKHSSAIKLPAPYTSPGEFGSVV